MDYTIDDVIKAREALLSEKSSKEVKELLRSPQFGALFALLKTAPAEQKSQLGKEVNALRAEVESWAEAEAEEAVEPIDVTAPWAPNTPTEKRPRLLDSSLGSQHVLTRELEKISEIFQRMGFAIEESRQIDDDYHMFESLNFPEGHPARDDWDTFMTDDGLIAPAHTSTMQNRMLKKYRANLETNEPIAVVVPGRTFRNEDLDARHEHTFHQVEGVYVGEHIEVGHLVGTMKTFLGDYFGKEVDVKITPFYFPFTEPSFEFSLTCPFCEPEQSDCAVCSGEHWIELMGMGMIHPNVLREGGINPEIHTGFAWGFGVERLVMMKNNIEDIRHFNSGKLEFLRQFGGTR
ncbi:phenylalanine--tRNA ligase subunit alpha [Candidatus Saccharibacteria bacterium]|nr:phenylalanine--tRNA ligase subunit alpha [Candidatus Saccharibacteria bacterium]